MQRTRTFIRSTSTLVVALSLLVTMPAFAEHGMTGSTGEASSSTETSHKTENHGGLVSKVATTEPTTDDSTETGDVHSRGAAVLAAAKEHHKDQKVKTADERKKVCEAHKQGLTQKFTRISANSDKIQTKIDGAFKKAQDYKTSKNIELANYDDLVAAATSAQSDSMAAISAMKAVQPTVDCNNVSVASDVATFKAAAQTTRDKLKAYRTSVKALLTALAGAKATSTTTTEGGN